MRSSFHKDRLPTHPQLYPTLPMVSPKDSKSSRNSSRSGKGPQLQRGPSHDAVDAPQRVIPNSPEAEKGVLSCMLQAPNECIGEATISLTADQFYHPGRQVLYEAILHLNDNNQPVDIISLTTFLRDRKTLDEVGGAAEIAEILSFAPAAAHFEYYSEIVRDKYVLRQVIHAGNDNIAKAYDDVPSVADLLDGYERDVLAIREGIEGKDGIRNMREHLMEAIHEIEEIFQNKASTTGVSTGFADYDGMTNGLHGGEMTIIAARPSMGKTSFVMNIVENVAVKEKVPVAVFSLEMSAGSLVQRLLCSQAGVPMNKIRSGMLSEKRDFPRIQRAASILAETKIYIDDTPSLSIMAMRAKCRRLHRQFGIGAIAVDYLQLMRSESKRAQENRQQEVAEISSGLKAIAKELNVPILVLAQLNRSPETRAGSNRPRLSDLRESGSIEQDADVVGLLMRDEYYAESDEERDETAGRSTYIIAKQRNGATGDVPLTFRKELMRFESRAADEHDEV
ncbi:MAG: replicative DNA helicase [Verrucomicrobiota bacterium]